MSETIEDLIINEIDKRYRQWSTHKIIECTKKYPGVPLPQGTRIYFVICEQRQESHVYHTMNLYVLWLNGAFFICKEQDSPNTTIIQATHVLIDQYRGTSLYKALGNMQEKALKS